MVLQNLALEAPCARGSSIIKRRRDEVGMPEVWPNEYPTEIISRILREKCDIPHQAFVMIVINDNGTPELFTTPGMGGLAARIFPRSVQREFANCVHARQISRESHWESGKDHNSSPNTMVRLPQPSQEGRGRWGRQEHHRKRIKPTTLGRRRISLYDESGSDSELPEPQQIIPVQQVIEDTPHDRVLISDKNRLTEFYDRRFKKLQQIHCKTVAKAWIKVLEPKKQSNFPYKLKDEKKPPWWPQGVEHREPDHMPKTGRVILLITILRCRQVSVETLMNATKEVVAHESFKEDKRAILEDIYRVARLEERFFREEIDHDTAIYIMDRADGVANSPTTYQSPDSDHEGNLHEIFHDNSMTRRDSLDQISPGEPSDIQKTADRVAIQMQITSPSNEPSQNIADPIVEQSLTRTMPLPEGLVQNQVQYPTSFLPRPSVHGEAYGNQTYSTSDIFHNPSISGSIRRPDFPQPNVQWGWDQPPPLAGNSINSAYSLNPPFQPTSASPTNNQAMAQYYSQRPNTAGNLLPPPMQPTSQPVSEGDGRVQGNHSQQYEDQMNHIARSASRQY
ncbi:MAG: hypothetical protein M1829_006276 [Trizodia sp. TS-e1964]|nr:MAG: hypothetical protein M1829_006276 [Trizodia sp. TS-e1964]